MQKNMLREQREDTKTKEMALTPTEHSTISPRVLVVSRRCVRKNKFVDFVGKSFLFFESSLFVSCYYDILFMLTISCLNFIFIL